MELLADWEIRRQEAGAFMPLEVELWHRQGQIDRRRRRSNLESQVAASGGQVVSEFEFPEIAYHGAVVEIPREAIADFAQNDPAAPLARWRDVKYLRPVGQAGVPFVQFDQLLSARIANPREPMLRKDSEPIVALFDGLPLQGHAWLNERLQVTTRITGRRYTQPRPVSTVQQWHP